LKHLGTDYEVVTFSIARKKEMLAPSIATQANAALGLLNLPTKVAAEELRIEDSFIGPGYGIPTNECLDAIRIVARTEAIFLDPVYTGKAMAGLIEWVKTGRFDSKRPIVFVHTGGIPALFAYYEELTA
jgi:1-aminocyclopropane-1-carboxylate deaminase/D-cysteine desulfhydrase-like pyridoxal-dependent ACC family enzyme